MTGRRPRFARLRRRFGLGAKLEPGRPGPAPAGPAPPPSPLAAIRGGLGDRPAPAAATGDQAAEAELDTLRGELVRELDKMSRRAAS